MIGPKIINTGAGQQSISAGKQILMVTQLLGTPETFRSIANLFDVAESTLWCSFERIICALQDISSEIICWPKGNYCHSVTEAFKKISGIPNVIGCIDGTHVPIKAPEDKPETYINRKSYHSIILQGVCDHKLKFFHCYAGCPGSMHDARVFKKSSVLEYMINNCKAKYHLLGDSAYPLSNFLITPFKDNGHLTYSQKKFNYLLSSTRSKIENAFALLKGRFRRLKYLDMGRTNLIPLAIIASCVLHNICIDCNEDIDDEFLDYDDDNMEEEQQEEIISSKKRDELLKLLIN